MKRLTSALGILLLAAGCGGSARPAQNAQPAQPPRPMQPMIAAPPVYALLGRREELNLTSAQIQVLDSVGTGLQTQNAEPMRQIREIRGDDAYRPRRLDQRDLDRLRPLVDQVRENNRQAQQRVREVLSTEQQQRVCELFREGRDRNREGDRNRVGDRRGTDDRERRPQRTGGMRPGMGGMFPDSAMMGPQRVWIFCTGQQGAGNRSAGAARDTTAAGRSRLPSDTTARPVRP